MSGYEQLSARFRATQHLVGETCKQVVIEFPKQFSSFLGCLPEMVKTITPAEFHAETADQQVRANFSVHVGFPRPENWKTPETFISLNGLTMIANEGDVGPEFFVKLPGDSTKYSLRDNRVFDELFCAIADQLI